MHRFPQIASPLHVEPEIRAVAEHAGENEDGRRGHIAAVVAQLIDVLALHPMALASAPWVRPIGVMNSSTRISPIVVGLRFVINMVFAHTSL